MSFTVTDTSDGVTLADRPQLTFVTPVATGSSITATPRNVDDDGTSQATINVYLQNELGRPAAGKVVKLSGGGSALIAPASAEVVTNAEGVATFTATDSAEESIGFSATDVSDDELPVPGVRAGELPARKRRAVPGYGADTGRRRLDCALALRLRTAQQQPGLRNLLRRHQVHRLRLPGTTPPTFDAAGNVFVADSVSGEIYEFGPAGGVGRPRHRATGQRARHLGDRVRQARRALRHPLPRRQPQPARARRTDPASGAIVRVIATAASGLQHFPTYLAVDPISGDIFVVDDGGGAGTEHFSVTRVANPDSASPTLSDYANVEGVQTALELRAGRHAVRGCRQRAARILDRRG